MRKGLLLALMLAAPSLAGAAEPITLPKPRTTGGKPLMEVLQLRQSGREFAPGKLSPQTLSDLLWAAFGINRPDGRRTAPSASNRQDIDIYAVMADGAYVYDPKGHRLEPVAGEDLRGLAATQDFAKSAPLNLVFVSDLSKLSGAEADRVAYAYAHTGFISQNVYLFCASEGLATVVRAGVNRAELAKALNLKETQRITLAQPVGHPR